MTRPSRRWTPADRGAAIVEFGLVVPIFVTLVVGMFSAGLAFNTNNSLNNGAREATRYGATLPVETTLDEWLGYVANAAFGATSGELVNGEAGHQVCVAYVYPDGTDANDQTMRLVVGADGDEVLIGASCFEDGRPSSERRVQVALTRDTTIQAVVMTSEVQLEATSVARFERVTG